MCNKSCLTKKFYLLLHNAPPLAPRVINIFKQAQFGEAVSALTKENNEEVKKMSSDIPKVILVPVNIPSRLWF